MRVPASSRYASSCLVFGERPYPSDYAPYRYRPHADNVEHALTQSDTLASLAGQYFAPIERACGLWWVIADFQPEPIVDPLVPLYVERQSIVIPSLRVVSDIVLGGSI